MSFLAGIIAQIVQWLLQKLIDFGIKKAKEIEHDQALVEQAKADQKLIEEAKTQQEKENALAKTIADTFHP